jgi:HPt (histidine-containing phosphotransfer) domain-containing protein
MDELRHLQRDYLDDVRRTVDDIRAHGRGLAEAGTFKSAFPRLLFLAHQLKGSGGSLGFPRISEVAQEMARRLDLFLDNEQVVRPTAEELSQSLLQLSEELEIEVGRAAERL